VGLETYTVLQVDDGNANSATVVDLENSYMRDLRQKKRRDMTGRNLPKVPSSVRFSTYVDFETDVLYLSPRHMRTKNMPPTFYRYEEGSSNAAPVLRFLEALVEVDEAQAKLTALAIHEETSYISSNDDIGVQRGIVTGLLELLSLQSISMVYSEGYCDDDSEDDLEEMNIYQSLGQRRISNYCIVGRPREWVRGVGGYSGDNSDFRGAKIGDLLTSAAGHDTKRFYGREHMEELPRLQSMKIWRRVSSDRNLKAKEEHPKIKE
jgi:hypothetical protein